MSSIKISQVGKGKHHWEEQLLKNQKQRLERYLNVHRFDYKTKERIRYLFAISVDKDNIVSLHTHPIELFVHYLKTFQLHKLTKGTSTLIIR